VNVLFLGIYFEEHIGISKLKKTLKSKRSFQFLLDEYILGLRFFKFTGLCFNYQYIRYVILSLNQKEVLNLY